MAKQQASSYWLGREFDVDFKSSGDLDYTKLAAAQRAIGNFVNIVTGKQIPVVFQSKEASYTDGERVVIGTKLEDKYFDPAVGLALHEGSHIAYTDFSLFKTPTGNSTTLFGSTKFAQLIRLRGVDPEMKMMNSDFAKIKDLLNWVEDRRIDYKIYTNAPGYRTYYEAMYDKYFNDKIIDKALKTGQKREETWDCYLFHIINFTNPNRTLGALSKLGEIWDVIDLKNISRLQSTTDALDVAIEVYKLIQSAVDKAATDAMAEHQSKRKAKSKSNDTSSSQSTTSSSSQPSEESNESGSDSSEESNTEEEDEDTEVSDEDSDTEEESEKEEDTESEVDANTEEQDLEDEDDAEEEVESEDEEDDEEEIQLTQKELNKLDEAIKEQKKFLDGKQAKTGRLSSAQASLVNAMRESGTESRIVYTGPAGKSDPITAVVIKKLTPGVVCAMPSLFVSSAEEYITGVRSYNSTSYGAKKIKENEEAITRGFILGKQLGNKLQVRNADRTLKTTRLQAGKIDRRLVSQLGFDNANVFHRIVTDRFKNYFIHISIDASGSMQGNKFHQAITSAVAIAQAASMTTGIRVQISFRGTSSLSGKGEKCVTMYAYDSAHDKLSKIRNMFKYLDVFGCTPEGLAFKSIENDIKADAKGDELIFINYSDGAPTDVSGCYRGYNGKEFTKHVVTNMRSNNINVISYFISDHNWESEIKAFKYMYGPDAQFIRPDNVTDVAKTINAKFLELAQ